MDGMRFEPIRSELFCSKRRGAVYGGSFGAGLLSPLYVGAGAISACHKGGAARRAACASSRGLLERSARIGEVDLTPVPENGLAGQQSPGRSRPSWWNQRQDYVNVLEQRDGSSRTPPLKRGPLRRCLSPWKRDVDG